MPVFEDMPAIVPAVAANERAPVLLTPPTEEEASTPEPKPERVYEFDVSSPNGGPTAGFPQADEPSTVAEPEPEPVVEAAWPPSAESAVPAGEVDLNPTTLVEVDGPTTTAEPDLEPYLEPYVEPDAEPYLEPDVDIPDTALIADLESPSAVEPFDQDAPEPKKRKWSLFRKGEDR